MNEDLKNRIKTELAEAKDKMSYINEIRAFIHSLSPMKHNPVDFVQWIHKDKIQANDYNPNQVALNEIKLLHTSISHDGFTQPIVAIPDPAIEKKIIVDGFHRHYVLKTNKDIAERNNNYLPIVEIKKDINDRMASTIRHNRARGKHSVDGMSNIVFSMLDNGWAEKDICDELGMEADELIRLKHITGFSKLFEDIEYKKAWKTKVQIQKEKEAKEKEGDTNGNRTETHYDRNKASSGLD